MRPASLRLANAALVLDRLADGRPASRAELAERTSLSPQALGAILADLVSSGLVAEQTRETSTPGRPPIEYALHPTGSFTASIVVRQVDFFVLIDDALRRRVATVRHRYEAGPLAAPLIAAIVSVLRRTTDEFGLDMARLAHLEFAVQGTIGEHGRIVGTTPAWDERDVDVVDAIVDELGRPIEVTATSVDRAQAMHALTQIEHGPNDLVAILHVGFETRLMLAKGSELVGNRFGDGGLLTHFPVPGNELRCECGETGCLGTVSGGRSVVAHYRAAGDTSVSTPAEIIDRIGQGDQRAIEAAQVSIDWLARGVTPILAMLRPDRIVCAGGGVGRPESPGAMRLVDALRAQLGDRLTDRPICVVAPSFVVDAPQPLVSPGG
ncbi:MAG: ROK family protein [Acidimicrobiales bacterium]